MMRYLATIGWTGPGAIPWEEYLEGVSAEIVAAKRQTELDKAHPSRAPHQVTCEPEAT